MLVTALWQTERFTGDIERVWTLDNIRTVLTDSVYRAVTLRTIGVAALVTVIDAVLALPVAFFMAKVAAPMASRGWSSRSCPAVGVLPGQGVRVASMLSEGGLIDWLGAPFGIQLARATG